MRQLALLAALALAGCGGISYAMNNYSDVEPQRFAAGGKSYRVFHKPAENRLMITPTIADAGAAGVIAGGTLGMAGDGLGPEAEFQAASQAFLDARQPGCKVTNGSRVLPTQYEFNFACT